jgi:hypothetical protein
MERTRRARASIPGMASHAAAGSIEAISALFPHCIEQLHVREFRPCNSKRSRSPHITSACEGLRSQGTTTGRGWWICRHWGIRLRARWWERGSGGILGAGRTVRQFIRGRLICCRVGKLDRSRRRNCTTPRQLERGPPRSRCGDHAPRSARQHHAVRNHLRAHRSHRNPRSRRPPWASRLDAQHRSRGQAGRRQPRRQTRHANCHRADRPPTLEQPIGHDSSRQSQRNRQAMPLHAVVCVPAENRPLGTMVETRTTKLEQRDFHLNHAPLAIRSEPVQYRAGSCFARDLAPHPVPLQTRGVPCIGTVRDHTSPWQSQWRSHILSRTSDRLVRLAPRWSP